MKLLVATEFAPNASGGGPAVVRQLLKSWPARDLLWWSCFPEKDHRFGQKVSSHEVAFLPSKLYPNQRYTRLRSWLLERLWVGKAANHFQSVIARHRPDVIWMIPHLWSIPPLARAAQQLKTGVHVSVHDYANISGVVRRLGSFRAEQFQRAAERLYRMATTRDAICRPMAEDLKRQTGQLGSISRAGIEKQDFEYLTRKKESATGPIRIAYAGTIIVEPEFELFIRAIKEAATRTNKRVQMEFFGAHSYAERSWFDASWMRENGNLPEPSLSEALRQCTWGFSPMALNDSDPQYNRYSFPTKFISYLAAGLPVVSMGHPESSLMKLAVEYRPGINLSTGDPASVAAQLERMLSISNPWAEFGQNVIRCGQQEFDAEAMRGRLYAYFSECAQTGRSK